MKDENIQQQFTAALDKLVEQIKDDRSILAAILCGSLSHDAVWAKSDIDLVLVTMDDKQAGSEGLSLYADGVNIHALLIPRSKFRQIVEGSTSQSFMHSFLAKGRLLYTRDQTIADLCGRLGEIGTRDTQVQLLRASLGALSCLYKAHKFFITRGDLDYTALWILSAATSIAQIEIISRHLLADREVIPQALKLNPTLFKTIYSDLLNTKKSKKNIQAALDVLDAYLTERTQQLFSLVIEHLRDVEEVRSCTEIENHFKRNYNLDGITTACEYLADQGVLGKAGLPVRLTQKSNISMQELAFFSCH